MKPKKKKTMKGKLKKSNATNMVNHSRCNLGALLNLVTELHKKIRMEHLQVLNKTPFGQFFKLFYDHKLNRKDIVKTSSNVTELVRSYSEDRDEFRLGGEWVKLTVDDVALTFGLPKKGRKVSVQQKNVLKDMQSEFLRRQFRGVELLKKRAIAEAMKRTIATVGKTAEEDFARLVILYMAVTIFFPNSAGTIGWGFVKHIEDLNSLNGISWAAVVHNHLMNIVKKHHRLKALQVPGCAIQILFWLCEHVEIISPIKGFENVSPRVARWSLSELARAMEKQSLEALPQEKVSIELKNISPDEKDLLQGEVEDDEDKYICTEMNAVLGFQVDYEGKKSISLDVNSIVKLEMNDERGKHIGSYEGDETRQTEEEGEFKNLMKENLRLEIENIHLARKCKELEAKMGQVTRPTHKCISVSEEGKGKSKTTGPYVNAIVEHEMDDERGKSIYSFGRDEMQQSEEHLIKENHRLENENIQISTKCKELEAKVRQLTLAKNNSSRMTEKGKVTLDKETFPLNFLGGEGEENDHYNDAQVKHTNKRKKAILQQEEGGTNERSPGKRLQSKKKVRNKDPEYKCNLPIKKRKANIELCKEEEPIYVDSSSPVQDIGEQLPKLKFSKVFDHLSEDQQEVVTTFFINADTSTVAWENNDETICITGSLLKDVMFNGFIDHQIIDWYAYHLQRREQKIMIKSIFFASLTWTFVRDGMKHSEKRCLIDVIEAMDDSTQLLFFPMNSSKTAEAKEGFHWTLLVLDRSVWEWKHYNSMMSRGQKQNNKYVHDAIEMKKRVTQVINTRFAKEEKKLIEEVEMRIIDCPQQGSSADCALYVCKLMDYLVQGKDLPGNFSEEAMGRERAMWTYEILSDPPRSWTLVDPKDHYDMDMVGGASPVHHNEED